MHPQAGVDETQQHARLRGGGWHGQRGSPRLGAVERDAVDQGIQRGVVDRRWIAGVRCRRSGGGRRHVAAFAGPTVPDRGGFEAVGSHCRVDRPVLHRVDFAQQQRHGRVEGRAVRLVCRRGGRSVRFGHYEHAIETHRVLDRGMGAGVDEVGAGPEIAPRQRGGCSCRHFRRERLHAVGLRSRGEHRVTRIGGSQCAGPGRALWGVSGAERRRPVRTQAAAELAVDDERGRDTVGCPSRRKGQVVDQGDR